jgi:membrane protein YqaA with SNARE-associated domain
MVAFAFAGALILLLEPWLSGMYLFAIYSVPANSLLPVPHEPGLLFFARFYPPHMIALAGCVGTGIGAAIDYPVVKRAFLHPKIQRARDTRLYALSVRWLMRYPFATIVLFAVTPLPVYVVRVLAPACGYPLWRYITATMVGRYPRYWLVAWIGHVFQIPGWVLFALFIVMTGLLVLGSRVSDDVGIDGLEVLDASDNAVPAEAAADLGALHDAAEATPSRLAVDPESAASARLAPAGRGRVIE